MRYLTRIFKNGTKKSYLVFDSGKKIALTEKEKQEYEAVLLTWKAHGKLLSQL